MSIPKLGGDQPVETIAINGLNYVAGLKWRPLQSARNFMAEAKAIGKAEGMDMVAIRKTRRVIQAGFAPRSKSKHKGKYSLAAALAGELGDNWLGAFQVGPDRYAMVAVHQGAVLPGRDFVSDRDAVLDALQQTYSLLSSEDAAFSDGQNIYCPAEFGFGGRDVPLTDVLRSKKLPKAYRLRPLTMGLTPGEIAGIAASVLIAGGAAYGGWVWWQHRQEEAARAAAAQAAAAARTVSEQATAAAAAGIVRPWVSQPSMAAMLSACAQQLDAAPLALSQWVFDTANCSATNTGLTYKSANASLADFQQAAKAVLSADGQPGGDGLANVSIANKLTPAADEALQNVQDVKQAFTELLRPFDGVASIIVTDVAKPDPATVPNAPPQPWNTANFVLTTRFPPERLLAEFPGEGVRITQINTKLNPDQADLTWTLTGVIYGR